MLQGRPGARITDSAEWNGLAEDGHAAPGDKDEDEGEEA